ncbi:MAG: PilN domain-containing protein [Acidobacteriota bacterium]|nr:PilN domain-containing protein [Acidobacteriota bacterium]
MSALDVSAENIASWVLVAGVVLGGLGYGGWWLSKDRHIASQRAEIADLQRTVDELEEIIAEVERFEARKADLEHKIEVISTLRNNQRGPVRIMDEISRSLPDFMWLDRLTLNAAAVNLAGRAFTTSSVANFIENLDVVGEFKEPVLRNATWRGQLYDFNLAFNYVPVPVNVPMPGEEGAAEDDGATQPAAR